MVNETLVKGVVEAVDAVKRTFKLKGDDTKYFLGASSKNLAAGEEVEFAPREAQGKYGPMMFANFPGEKRNTAPRNSNVSDDRRQVLIVRQSSLGHAVNLLSTTNKKATVKDVISLASQLEEWVNR